MATVTAKLIGILQATVPSGLTVDITLCGYQSRSPVSRAPVGDNGTFADINLLGVAPTLAGDTISVDLIGNDVIVPAGTYYTFTFRNGNGDILQCNAYAFIDANSYDLTATDPFDPALPTPPLPPLIVDQLQVLTNQNPASFDGLLYTAFKAEINQDTTIEVSEGEPGNLYTFLIVQDGAGGHVVTWGANIYNAAPANLAPNGVTVQTFILDDQYNFFAIAPATWYTP